MADQEGTQQRFDMGPLLGSGTFGEVYLARMTTRHGIEQDVAVKLLNPGVDARSQPVSRMRDEGRALAALNHPAILQVMDFCHLEQRIGLVTEFVPGADLDACIHQDDPIPPRSALQCIGQVADALHAAWDSRTTDGRRLGMVHRDIKPANIRITPHGSVKLLDFGIAKSADAQRETETQNRMAFGTPAYMAPEILSYEVMEALPSRDIFALGCTLYEALVRERFYEGQDHRTISRISNREGRYEDWRATRMLRLVDQDPAVVDLLARMLAYEHHDRPSAKEVAETCLEVADRMNGPALWNWGRHRDWPTVEAGAGPWTGRTVFDVPLTLSTGAAPAIDPAGRASVLESDGAAIYSPGGQRLGEISATGALPVLPAVAPRARQIDPNYTSPLPLDGTMDPAARQAPPPSTPPAATTSTLLLPMQHTISLVAIAVLFVAGIVLAAGLVIAARPDILAPVFGPRPARTAVAGEADDTGAAPTTPAAQTVSAGEYAWGAQSQKALATIVLEGSHDVRLIRGGKRPIKLPPHGYVRIEPGLLTVTASLPGTGGYAFQFETSVGPDDTLRIRCDERRRRCEKSR